MVRIWKPVRNVRLEQKAAPSPFPIWENEPVTEPQRQGPMHLQGFAAPSAASVIKRKEVEKREEHHARSFDDGYRQGWEAGIEEGRRISQVEYETRLSEERQRSIIKALVQLETLMASIKKEFTHLQSQSEEIMMRFALSIAELVVKRQVRLDNTIVLAQIKEALRRVVGVEHIKVRVHPSDEAMVREQRATIMANSDSLRDIVIEGDPKVEAGGCILESDSGNVDARLSTQLKKIEAALLDSPVS
ncbi:MAG: FliH/SctL family protein [Ignavibacteriales bacterium]|nr:FliH/SctL family protein [Ignavibacteriales bacterium]